MPQSNRELPFFNNLQKKPFELQVWLVITVIGGLRTLKAVVQDIVGYINIDILIIDLLILSVFIALGGLIYLKKISRVPMIVGVLLILLLTFSYVQFGGVQGASEYNLMALGVLLVLAYRGRQLIWMMSLLFALILIANLDLHFNGWLTQNFFKAFSISRDNYITTLFAVVLLMLYFKSLLVVESNRLMKSRLMLNDQIKSIQALHLELEQQQKQLHEVNETLEGDIKKHTSHIVSQNKAIENYISLSTELLDAPLQSICTNLESLSEKEYLEKQLRGQITELNLVIHNLKNDLKQHGTDKGR